MRPRADVEADVEELFRLRMELLGAFEAGTPHDELMSRVTDLERELSNDVVWLLATAPDSDRRPDGVWYRRVKGLLVSALWLLVGSCCSEAIMNRHDTWMLSRWLMVTIICAFWAVLLSEQTWRTRRRYARPSVFHRELHAENASTVAE